MNDDDLQEIYYFEPNVVGRAAKIIAYATLATANAREA